MKTASDLEVGGSVRDGQAGYGQLNIHDGALVSAGGNLYVGVGAPSGSGTAGSGTMYSWSAGDVTVSDSGSALVVAGNVYLGNAANGSSAVCTLTVNPGATVDVGGTVSVNSGGVYLNGGTLRAAAFAGQPVSFYWGTLEYKSDLTVSVSDWLEGSLGLGRPIGFAQELQVDGTTTLYDVLTLSGGTFSTGRLVNPSYFQFQSGTFDLTGDNLSVGPGGLFGSQLVLPAWESINVTGSASIAASGKLSMQGGGFSAAMLSNSGTIGGSGQIGAPLLNTSRGQVRAFTGDHPVFNGAGNVNQGKILLYGGVVEFTGTLTNNPGGLIQGNGSLIVSGGLVNWASSRSRP